MSTQTIAKTDMIKFWQFLFDHCNEDYSCVLGWILVGILVFLVVIVGLGKMLERINKRRE